ncbi:transposase domain-containing protein [Methylopila sp. M107]|uniref:transposase domain-containing protein n=1 Tax=Methylopila sp. M107 TaxID=1101190 RepID=UPI000379D08D|nr:transposase domain-containing protein [Methylopila sp. M107]
MREWLAVPDILALNHPALPRDRRELDRMALRQGWRADPDRARMRPGVGREGGAWEYHVSLLPAEARPVAREVGSTPDQNGVDPISRGASNPLWERFERLSDDQKAEARRRLAAIDTVIVLSRDMTRNVAVSLVAEKCGCSVRTVFNWIEAVKDVAKCDRLAAIAPRRTGRTATEPCDPRAWDFLKALWLAPESRVFESCDRRMREAAAEHGWSPIPSPKTMQRRLEREIPRAVQTLARKGADAARALYPHQTRDRSVFHAMQAVNADGHRFDVFVKWPDGTVARPVMVAIQDLYSGAIVGHRVDRSENWTCVRHAFADMFESYGIPDLCWLDNGRSFASKWLTGGAKTRYRFKIRDDEPAGILTALGVEVRWATPYHGQAKPIERAFGDLAEEIAKHPTFAGAYTGKKPTEKPDNYASSAVPLETFLTVVAREIRRHNERPGRRSATAAGRSFAETFRQSVAQDGVVVRRATAAQRRMFLMAAEGVTARKGRGEIQLAGNRYWAEQLSDVAGRKVTVRFDPDDLLQPVAVYAIDGRFICEAPCVEAEGFADMTAAQTHARARNQWFRGLREMLNAERRMTIGQAADLLPTPAPFVEPASKVVRLVANGVPQVSAEDWSGAENFGRALRGISDADILPFQRE